MSTRREARDATKGELRRARERAHQLACVIEALGESVIDAIDSTDPAVIANRLTLIVASGVGVLNELAAISGRLGAIGAVQRDL